MNSAALQALFPPGIAVDVATPADEDESLLYAAELALMGAMVPARRKEFAAGRNAARRALAQLGFPPTALPRRVGDRDIEWPAGATGSISHTNGLRAIACARIAPELRCVGLDVEQAGPLGDDIRDAICRPDELDAMAELPPPLPSDWPRLLFAMKEAAFKAWYPVSRRMLDFHDMRIAVDVAARTYVGDVLDGPEPGLQLRGRFAWSDRYVAAGAILSSGGE